MDNVESKGKGNLRADMLKVLYGRFIKPRSFGADHGIAFVEGITARN